MIDEKQASRIVWTDEKKRVGSIALFASGGLLLVVTPITALGLFPEIGILAAVVFFAVSLVMGVWSMRTTLGRLLWIAIELLLIGAIAFFAWKFWIALYLEARFG